MNGNYPPNPFGGKLNRKLSLNIITLLGEVNAFRNIHYKSKQNTVWVVCQMKWNWELFSFLQLSRVSSNAAEHSSAKRAVKIMRCLGSEVPLRATKIFYIQKKHHEISPEVFKWEAIGSLSNCSACHTTTEKGIYENDNVVIPKWNYPVSIIFEKIRYNRNPWMNIDSILLL